MNPKLKKVLTSKFWLLAAAIIFIGGTIRFYFMGDIVGITIYGTSGILFLAGFIGKLKKREKKVKKVKKKPTKKSKSYVEQKVDESKLAEIKLKPEDRPKTEGGFSKQ